LAYKKISGQLTNLRNNLYNIDLLNEFVNPDLSQDYGESSKKIKAAVKENPIKYKLLRFAYVFVPTKYTLEPIELNGKQKKFVNFLIDAVYDSSDDESLPGAPFEITYKPFFQKTFQSKLPSSAEKPLADEWGIYMQALAPILDEKGNAVAALGIDVTVETVETELKQLRTWSVIIIVSFAFIALGASTILARYFSKPINQLNEGVNQFAAKNFSARIHFKSQSKWSYDQIRGLADNFNAMAQTIQDYSENLEEMVRKRTEELNQSLQEVQNLTIQQHGDYFLTSLLIEPLTLNNNLSKLIKTEFYLHQKKQFQFRNKSAELGGDICATDSFQIQGVEYTVFMNGDAMGKSMQGAGGAIVMGVVFTSILNRTKNGEMAVSSAREWLEKTFFELESVFRSFDGSMLISAVIGVISPEGKLFYLNAEHPFTVLYRNGVSSFIDDQIHTRKFGSNHFGGPEILEYQLEPGDILFCGSDGRDDLELRKDEAGIRVINENEFLFLEHIQRAEGDLQKLIEIIQLTGNLTDDLSLMKIHYLGVPIQRPNKTPDEIQNLFQEAKYKLRTKNYKSAYKNALNLYELEPDSPEVNKLIGKCAYLVKEYSKAAYHLEKAFYLKNDYHDIALGIAKSYYEIGNYQRAYYYSHIYLENNPENPIALKIIESLLQSKGESLKNFEETILRGVKV